MRQRLMATALTVLTAASALQAEEIQDADSASARFFDLDEVVVTGVRVPKLLKDTPVQTRLITMKEIQRSDATDIQDLLTQEMPGLEFTYAMNQQTHLNFNGQGGQSVLFLVDGERMAGETMDDVDFSRLTMSNVDHIEIVKGASSALYGSNAGGGVINIITRKAVKPLRVAADARFGRHGDRRYNLSLTTRRGRVSNILTGHYHTTDNYDVRSAADPVTRVVTTIYGNRVANVTEQLGYTPVDGLKLTARAGFFYRQLKRVEDTPERYRDYTAGLRGEWQISDDDMLNVSYAFDQYDKSDYRRISGLDVRSYSNVNNSVRALYSHTFGDYRTLTAGADFMHDYMLNTKLSDPRRSQNSADVFAQYDRIIGEKWEAVGALRYDYFSDGGMSRVTPKLSVRYRPRHNVNIRAGYGMGFRAPTLKEKYYDFDMAGIWIVRGNPSLRPESSHNFTLSADYTEGNCHVTVSGYYNDIHNRIATGVPYYLPDDPHQLYLDYVNLRHYTVAGCEVALKGRWINGLSASLTYAYTDEHLAEDRDGNTINNQYIPARPHSLTARADWEKTFADGYTLTASLNGRVLSGVSNIEYRDYYDIAAGTVRVDYPAYTLWKLSVSQTLTRYVKVSLAVDNIFNYKPLYYYLNCPLTDGTAFIAGVSIDFY